MGNNNEGNQAWLQSWLFDTPLYAETEIDFESIFWLLCKDVRIDGHCPFCGRGAIFHRDSGQLDVDKTQYVFDYGTECLFLSFACGREKKHRLIFAVRIAEEKIQKIGQWPSLADIANDESRRFRSVIDQASAAELHRAIGLAAHGVGIGSFVYLRRVFERVVNDRFEQVKDSEGWDEADFTNKRMEEKIDVLKNHLPDFLVNNQRIYGILSKGIHELTEEECLKAFEFLKQSIFFILEEDEHKRQMLERRKSAEKAISAFPIAKNVE